MNICENCGKEHDSSYGSGRFCSKECAKAYASKSANRSPKITNCIKCGKEITVAYNANIKKCMCYECKGIRKKLITLDNTRNNLGIEHYRMIKNQYVKCKVCGNKYLKGEKCDNKFCQKHSIQQFKSLIKYFGFDESKLGTIEVVNEFFRIKNILFDLYWNQHKSSIEICKLFNYPSASNLLDKIFKYLDIKHKTLSEAVAESYLMNRSFIDIGSNKYNSAWHVTWDGKNVYLRSSYELDYANELDKKQIEYDVETLRIKYYDSIQKRYRCAIPDFYLKDTNELVEIKSTYTLGGDIGLINLKDKFKEYKNLGYKCKLILDHKEVNINSF